MKDEKPQTPQDPASPSLRPGRGGIVPPVHSRFKAGQPSANPGGRPQGGASISEALQILVAGGAMPRGTGYTPAWEIASAMIESAKEGDPRTLAILLERTEGKVPTPIQACIEQNTGVVLLPAEKLETEAWARLAAATFGDRYSSSGPALPPKTE